MSKATFNDESNCICLCGLKLKEKKKKCSDHLKNWELWMQRRRRIHKTLGKLGREPGNLLMNIGDEYKNLKEDKLVLGYTKIETHFDKLRGNPSFWKLPTSLKSRVPPYGTSDYFLVKSKEENNEIPMIEYVGISNYILKEKDIMPRTRNLYTLWKNNNSYREYVVQRMASKILEIEPHKPDLHNLVLIGQKIKSNSSKELSVPLVPQLNKTNDSPLSSIKTVSEEDVDETPNRISLKINNLTFNKGETSYCYDKICVIFEYFMDSMMPCLQSILFENTGQVVLRLYWNKYRKFKIFHEYSIDSEIFRPFKFNRNEILLLPGQKINFSIKFEANKPGNYFEYWELSTLPIIWSQDYHLVIVFKGFAFIKHFDEKVNILTQNLNQRIRNTVVKDLLSDIISKGNYCTQILTHSYDFSEKELFESVNLKENICLRTPKYVYNKQIIAELKEFYQEIRQPNDAEEWNLSIKKLKEISRKKDLFLYFQNNMTAYDTAKIKRISLQNNLGENQNTKQQKLEKLAVGKPSSKIRKELIPTEVEDPTQTQSYYNRLKVIMQKLEKPSIRPNLDRKKYFFSYTIIKINIFKMFDQIHILDLEKSSINDIKDQIRKSQSIAVNTLMNQQIQNFQDRVFYEIFDESYVLKTKRISSEPSFCVAKPKSTLLKGISSSDVKRICRLYFNKDEPNEKGQKKKTQIQDNASKKTPSKKADKSKNSDQAQQDFLNVREYFDPFIEEFPVELEKRKKPSTQFELNIKNREQIKSYEEKYLIIYTTLCKAVDDLVATIDGFKNLNIPSDTLRELQTCSSLPVKSDHNKIIPKRTTINSIADSLTEKRLQTDTSDKDEYFKFLVESHWENNVKTKKYFVRGEKQRTVSNKKQGICKTEDEVKAPSNIFSLETYRRKPEPYGTKDKEMQTSSMDLKVPNKLYEKEPSNHGISVKDLELSSSKNIFYFLDHICEQEDAALNDE